MIRGETTIKCVENNSAAFQQGIRKRPKTVFDLIYHDDVEAWGVGVPTDFLPFPLCVRPVFFLRVSVSVAELATTIQGDFQRECFRKILQAAVSK